MPTMPGTAPSTGLMPPAPRNRLSLPQVTLCAVSSANVPATIRALETSLAHIAFADAILFTHADQPKDHLNRSAEIRLVEIERLNTSAAYSEFLLAQVADHVRTSHCLIVQWDGHVIDAARWRPEFLEYDYIGARWPQFADGRDVGNGGFSLRSRRLMAACQSPKFERHHPEDLAICHTNRALLDDQGMRFAPGALADAFAAERAGDPSSSFGYHGVFLMPRVLGAEAFWKVYRTLDERSSLRRDFGDLIRAMQGGPNSILRSLRMLGNHVADWVCRLITSRRHIADAAPD